VKDFNPLSQQALFEPLPSERLEQFNKDFLIEFIKEQQKVNDAIIRDNNRLRELVALQKQATLLVGEQYIVLRNKIFGKSSERSPHETSGGQKPEREKKKRVLLPSERYPDALLVEQDIDFKEPPVCDCCGDRMWKSGMTEDSEHLTVIPKKYVVVRQKRHKYECRKCHGDIQTAPLPPRIKEGSSYSDEMIIDVATTKYCDLIPIERYAAIAARGGLEGLPPQSLIESTHYLADFVKGAYEKLRGEVVAAKVLHADETPHRMLEGDWKSHWYLWGFSTRSASYFECHNTRSGDVASGLLTNAQCEHLVSDVYTGYGKAVRVSNQDRQARGLPCITHVYCNSHARRYFKQGGDRSPKEAEFFIAQYREVYRLEDLAKDKPPDEVWALRQEMKPYFKSMKQRAIEAVGSYSSKSLIAKAMKYFVRNYEGLTRFLDNPDLPIDNNPQERLMRNPVIGRKTWYGTHSKLGARTAAILFSLVESCKLNKINPKEYFRDLVAALHRGEAAFTPAEYKAKITQPEAAPKL